MLIQHGCSCCKYYIQNDNILCTSYFSGTTQHNEFHISIFLYLLVSANFNLYVKNEISASFEKVKCIFPTISAVLAIEKCKN